MPDRIALENALMFDYAYNLLYEQMQRDAKNNDKNLLKLFVPVTVNCSFSCELFMKTMLPTGTKGHELKTLFYSLNNIIVERITTEIIKMMQLSEPNYSKDDFENDLTAINKAFDQWRYFHEDRCSIFSNIKFMHFFEKCLKGFAIIYGQ